jgi:hypothetical protein
VLEEAGRDVDQYRLVGKQFGVLEGSRHAGLSYPMRSERMKLAPVQGELTGR